MPIGNRFSSDGALALKGLSKERFHGVRHGGRLRFYQGWSRHSENCDIHQPNGKETLRKLSLLFPETGEEKDEHGIELQAAEQHEQGENRLPQWGNSGIVLRGSHGTLGVTSVSVLLFSHTGQPE